MWTTWNLDRMYCIYSYLKIKNDIFKKLCKEGLISIIMHNLWVFCSFSTFVQKIFKGWGWNFTRTFGKVMRSKSIKMVFMASIISHYLMSIITIPIIASRPPIPHAKRIFKKEFSIAEFMWIRTFIWNGKTFIISRFRYAFLEGFKTRQTYLS